MDERKIKARSRIHVRFGGRTTGPLALHGGERAQFGRVLLDEGKQGGDALSKVRRWKKWYVCEAATVAVR